MTQKSNIIELEKKAVSGDPNSQYELGLYYAENDTSRDFISWFKKAAEQNHPLAYNKLGISYATGYGTPRDLVYAEQMFISAIEFGFDAHNNLDTIRKKIEEESQIKPYYLVKITDKQWADKLLDGEIFMRSLLSFGDFKSDDKRIDNDYRGDILEGLSNSFAEGTNSNFFNDISDGKPCFQGSGFFDMLMAQEKIFSLYALEYDAIQKCFISPDKRLLEFGDTSVIVLDSNEFLKRIFSGLLNKFGNSFWISFKRVKYNVDLSKLLIYDEFHKRDSYSWQNEFRIALDLSEGKLSEATRNNMTDYCKHTYMRNGGTEDIDIRPESVAESIVIKIGDIRDICALIPTSELINCELSKTEIDISKPPDKISPLEIPRKPIATVYKPIFIP
jgi:hypothetical protein